MSRAVRDAGPAPLLALASLAAVVLLTAAIGAGVVFPFDAPLLAAARTLDGNPTLWQAVSQTANIPLIVIAVLLEAWLIRARRHREAVLVLVLLVAITAASEGVKQLTGRPRPSGSGDGIPGVIYSYPSGHVLEAMTILGILVVKVWRSPRPVGLRLAFAALVAVEVVLVAVARVALNEHYPTDILAGVLGALCALGCYAWLTRPGGWADHPAAAVRHRSGLRSPTGPRRSRHKEAAT